MIESFVITFRETLEVALVIGIILSYLVKTKQTKYNNTAYMGIVFGIIASIIGAFLFKYLTETFSGKIEQIFEGIIMLIGAFLLTSMILWMIKQKHIAKKLEYKIAAKIAETYKWGLFLLVFTAVLREGIETVIFLSAASFVSTNNNLIGALIGIAAAIFLGYMIFLSSMKINIKKFFNITSILLIFFAAGLVVHGVHEFQEAKVIPPVIEHVWDINPPINNDGNYPLMHEEGYVGSILKGLFGYNGNPSLIEILSFLIYFIIIFVLWKNIEKTQKEI